MLFSLRSSSRADLRPPYSSFGSGLLGLGLFMLLFGMAIFIAPELLAYIVASFFIIVGATMIMVWWRLRR